MKRKILSEAFEQAAGPEVEFCPTCLGPFPMGPGCLLVNLANLRFCPECGLLVDAEDGRSKACRWGKSVFCKVMVITDRPPISDEAHREGMARIEESLRRWREMSGSD